MAVLFVKAKECIKLYFISLKQKEILDIVNKFRCISYDQIKKLTGFKDLDKELKVVLMQKRIKEAEEKVYCTVSSKEIDTKILKVLDVYIFLKSSGKSGEEAWCQRQEFPFTAAIFFNGKIFDVGVINNGEENNYLAAMDRSRAERIIIILQEESQVNKIKLNKMFRYCIIKNGAVNFFEKGED